VITDPKGDEAIKINDVIVKPIVIDNFDKDTKIVIIEDPETNKQTTYIDDVSNRTITEVTKSEDKLVEVSKDEVEVIPSNATVVTPILDNQDNVESICVSKGGNMVCSDVKDTVIEPTPEPLAVIDITVPTGPNSTVKVVESDSEKV